MTAPICYIAAEKALICILLADQKSGSHVIGQVIAADFYDSACRNVFQAIVDSSGGDWDRTTVARTIARQHGQDAARRAIELMLDLETAPVSGTVTTHARAIGEASRKRRVASVLSEAAGLASEGLTEQALELVSSLDGVSIAQAEPVGLQQLMLDSYAVAKTPRGKAVLTSGHWWVDELTGGMTPGDCWVVGGGTSQGKSSFAIAVADENMKNGRRVIIVSIEDAAVKFGNRFLARRTGVDAKRIRDRRLTPDDHRRIAQHIATAPTDPMFLHCPGEKFERVAGKIDSAVVRYDPDLIVLDYIQECTTERDHGSGAAGRMLELQAIARSFRAICRKRKVAGIINSQLTGYEDGKPPTNQMVRECKDIVNGAECVLLLYSVNDGNEQEQTKRRLVNVDKSKDGGTGIVELDWDNVTASFRRVLPESPEYDDLDDIHQGITG
jgi:replicative DNA helicase